jgi:mono/diheme cytochrome c family protein
MNKTTRISLLGIETAMLALSVISFSACRTDGGEEHEQAAQVERSRDELEAPMVPPSGKPVAGTSLDPAAPGASMSGRDVYRLNCQACHGPAGAGTPQAPTLLTAAQKIASGGDDSEVRGRLTRGGERMPAFPHLSRPEVDAIISYLGVLGGAKPVDGPTVAAPTGRDLGERIYRSNCASCHESGRATSTGMMCQPATLAGATERFSKAQVMNLLNVGVGPMPAFPHLAQNERDALWTYLQKLPSPPGMSRTMGETCWMVRAAMEGRPMGTMRGPSMRGRMMGPGDMMQQGMGCPMMDPPSSRGDGAPAQGGAPKRLPPCCR